MTREEQIKNYAINNCIQDDTDDTSYEIIVETAKWADETMLDKACEWLLNIDFDGQEFRDCNESFNNDLFVNTFRKAMEV